MKEKRGQEVERIMRAATPRSALCYSMLPFSLTNSPLTYNSKQLSELEGQLVEEAKAASESAAEMREHFRREYDQQQQQHDEVCKSAYNPIGCCNQSIDCFYCCYKSITLFWIAKD